VFLKNIKIACLSSSTNSSILKSLSNIFLFNNSGITVLVFIKLGEERIFSSDAVN